MICKSIPVVHPRVIELSRSTPRVFAISLGSGCGPGASTAGTMSKTEEACCDPTPKGSDGCCDPAVFALDPDNSFGFGVGTFGVKRPLRFLAYKLKLTEPQVSELASILDELKTERAQAAVDDRRTLAAFADAMSQEAFDEKKASEGAALREKSADRLAEAVVKALGRIHKLLTPEQRERFAYLIRTGTVLL